MRAPVRLGLRVGHESGGVREPVRPLGDIAGWPTSRTVPNCNVTRRQVAGVLGDVECPLVEYGSSLPALAGGRGQAVGLRMKGEGR